jgi:hypothetical protein
VSLTRSRRSTASRVAGEIRRGRGRSVVEARQVACYVLRETKFLSFPTIGGIMGDRDHSIVIHACSAIALKARMDARLRERIDQVRMLSSVHGLPCGEFVAGYLDERPVEFLPEDQRPADSCARLGCGWMRALHAAELCRALPAPQRRAA